MRGAGGRERGFGVQGWTYQTSGLKKAADDGVPVTVGAQLRAEAKVTSPGHQPLELEDRKRTPASGEGLPAGKLRHWSGAGSGNLLSRAARLRGRWWKGAPRPGWTGGRTGTFSRC